MFDRGLPGDVAQVTIIGHVGNINPTGRWSQVTTPTRARVTLYGVTEEELFVAADPGPPYDCRTWEGDGMTFRVIRDSQARREEVLVSGAAIQFTAGTASSFDIAAATASAVPGAGAIQSITPTLTLTGVTMDAANGQIDYDGTSPSGSIAQTDYLVQRAGTRMLIRYRVPSVAIVSALSAPATISVSATTTGTLEDPAGALIWSAVSGATGYRVYRSATSGSAGFSAVADVSPSPNYVDPVLGAASHDATYWWYVKPLSGAVEGPASGVVTARMLPGFISSVPSPLDIAVGSYYDLDQHILDADDRAGDIELAAGDSLPAGMALAQTPTRRVVNTSATPGAQTTNVNFRLRASAEDDWQARIATTGVVWYHDFRSANEVSNFRWTGNAGGNDPDPDFGSQDVQWDSTVGITGGSMKLVEPATPSDNDSGWWRPFSPIVAGTTTGNGRTTNDPGNGGAIAAGAWNPSNPGQLSAWTAGYYGHPNYQNAQFDGHDYWLQVIVKPNGQAWLQPFEDRSGKFIYFHACTGANSLQAQEIINSAFTQQVNGGGSFYMVRSQSFTLQDDYQADTGIDISQVKPGGTCNFGTNPSGCWSFRANEWNTILYHFKLGTQEAGDTFFEAWAAHQDETSYTKIWEQGGIPLPYENPAAIGQQRGHNAILVSSGYNMNRQGTITADAINWVGQLIFAKGDGTTGTPLIPCPQVY